MLKVGDEIEFMSYNNQRIRGIIRHIGKLNNFGDDYSIWSSWEKEWNGLLLPSGIERGQLTYIDYNRNTMILVKKKVIKEVKVGDEIIMEISGETFKVKLLKSIGGL